MGSDQRTIRARRTTRGVHRIVLTGELGPASADQLEQAVEDAIRVGAIRIELDFARTWVADPEDLICLVDVHRRTTRNRVELRLVNMPLQVKQQMSRTLLPALLQAN
jgi:hypothetical protein